MVLPTNDQRDRVTQMQSLLQARNGRSYTRAEARRILQGLAKIITTLATIESANQIDD
jgi:predicted nuclease of restriction endonuclease-like RecB superfamily